MALAVAASAVLPSCGERSDRERIEDAITEQLTNADPDGCTEHATTRFHEELEAVRGPAAVEACKRRAGAPGSAADSVEVVDVRLDGDRSTATVTVRGGRLDGQRTRLALAERDGRWKLDGIAGLRLRGRVLTRFVRQFRRQVRTGTRVSLGEADCIVARIERDLSSVELGDLVGGEVPPRLRSRIESATSRCVGPP